MKNEISSYRGGYFSIVGPEIDEYIQLKHDQGYSYIREQRAFKSFDHYCYEQGLQEVEDITPTFINSWYCIWKTSPKTKDYRYLIRHFCIYLKTVKNFNMEIMDTRFKEANPKENYHFGSIFASILRQFIDDKHRSGYKYESEEKIMKYFDLLCIEQDVKDTVLTKALVQQWSIQKPSEGVVYRSKRVSIIRQFALFLNARGFNAYIAPGGFHAESEKPHIFSTEEIGAIFQCTDQLQLESPLMRFTLPVIFRFYYCLGLRLNEAIKLNRDDVDLETGKVTIRMAKCLKDRIVYLPTDLKRLAELYDRRIAKAVPSRTLFFVSDELGSEVRDTGLCGIFNRVWRATGFAESADKKPTIHSFRHTFTVRKLEDWYAKKIDYTYWLPYLSAHLGHSRLEATYGYIHLVDSAFPLIREAMGTFEKLYPEVDR